MNRGTKVDHQVFGPGVVEEVTEEGARLILEVRFASPYFTKKLDYGLAKEFMKETGLEALPYKQSKFEVLLAKTPTSKKKKKTGRK